MKKLLFLIVMTFITISLFANDSDFIITEYNCLEKYKGKDSYVFIPDNVVSIDPEAFNLGSEENPIYNTTIKTIKLPNNLFSFKIFNSEPFQYCSALENFEIDSSNKYFSTVDGVLFNKDKSILCRFPRGKAKEYYSIPENVKYLYESAFFNCSKIHKIKLNNNIHTIPDCAFLCCYKLQNIELPKYLTEIGNASFGYTSISNIDLPLNLQKIGNNTFMGCSNLKSISIPYRIKEIGENAFPNNCKVNYEKENPNFDYTEYDFETDENNCLLKYWGINNKVAFPIYITSLKKDAFLTDSFNSNKIIEKIYIHGNFENISDNPFSYCSNLKEIEVGKTNQILSSENGILYDKIKSELICFPANKNLDYFEFPNSVNKISNIAFYCSKLREIKLSNNIKTIPCECFIYCYFLEKINLENVNNIEHSAFSGCEKLNNITLSENLKKINIGTFNGCKSLSEINLPDNITILEEYAFQYCINLNKVIFPKKLKIIKTQCFDCCFNLEEINLPDTLEIIETKAFDGCKNLKEVHIPKSVKEIGEDAFPKTCRIIRD